MDDDVLGEFRLECGELPVVDDFSFLVTIAPSGGVLDPSLLWEGSKLFPVPFKGLVN